MESEFIGHEACPACGSKDNLARYSDGHAFCFGCEYYEPGEDADGEGNEAARKSSTKTKSKKGLLGPLRFEDLPVRKIKEETCRKFGYGKVNGKQVANFVSAQGRVVAQHVRSKDKGFCWLGDKEETLPLWGQQLWRDHGKMVVITEGEIDCMTVSQLQRNKWPVVSIRSGAQGASRDIRDAIEWLEAFDSVVFMFDMDEPGRAAAEKCAALLSPGKAKIARLDYKDANEALQAGKGDHVIDAVWSAKTFRPDGIILLDDLLDEDDVEEEWGIPWWTDKLTKLTYGRRYGEIYTIGAGTGVGKTDFLTQQVQFDICELDRKVAVFFLEQPVRQTMKRIAGKVAGRRFHIPSSEAGWTKEEYEAAKAGLPRKRLYLFKHFGVSDWEIIKSRIRYLAVAEHIRIFYLDHLTALAAMEPDERKALEEIMAELGGMVQELSIMITVVSHLTTPEGKPHEEGGRVMIRHFKGSRAIGFWSHYMIGLERDQQADDPEEQRVTTYRVLKDRVGTSTGATFTVSYDDATGRLFEIDRPDADCPFDAETDDTKSDF